MQTQCEILSGMIYGDPDPLYSSYHIGYNMVLNMLRVEDADPEHLLRSSFHQYQVCVAPFSFVICADLIKLTARKKCSRIGKAGRRDY